MFVTLAIDSKLNPIAANYDSVHFEFATNDCGGNHFRDYHCPALHILLYLALCKHYAYTRAYSSTLHGSHPLADLRPARIT